MILISIGVISAAFNIFSTKAEDPMAFCLENQMPHFNNVLTWGRPCMCDSQIIDNGGKDINHGYQVMCPLVSFENYCQEKKCGNSPCCYIGGSPDF